MQQNEARRYGTARAKEPNPLLICREIMREGRWRGVGNQRLPIARLPQNILPAREQHLYVAKH